MLSHINGLLKAHYLGPAALGSVTEGKIGRCVCMCLWLCVYHSNSSKSNYISAAEVVQIYIQKISTYTNIHVKAGAWHFRIAAHILKHPPLSACGASLGAPACPACCFNVRFQSPRAFGQAFLQSAALSPLSDHHTLMNHLSSSNHPTAPSGPM